MKQKSLPILVVVLAITVLAVGCKKQEETTINPPPAATEPAPAPAPEMPPPATEPMPSTPAPTDSGMSFDDMDKNKDGGITKDELADTEMLSQHFATADKDGDGKLSKSEVDGHRAEMMPKPGG